MHPYFDHHFAPPLLYDAESGITEPHIIQYNESVTTSVSKAVRNGLLSAVPRTRCGFAFGRAQHFTAFREAYMRCETADRGHSIAVAAVECRDWTQLSHKICCFTADKLARRKGSQSAPLSCLHTRIMHIRLTARGLLLRRSPAGRPGRRGFAVSVKRLAKSVADSGSHSTLAFEYRRAIGI